MKIGQYRWRIMTLLFFATTINYLDRHVLSILAPELQTLYGWSEVEYGYIVTAFQVAYGLGVVFSGQLLDRFGVRWVYAIALVLWSVAGMGHALARSAMGFAVARFFLGIGESANFPAAIKTVAEWFPRKERAFATGLFNAGSNVGAILSPLLIPWVALQFGWQWAFISTGLLGFFWLSLWLTTYRKPEKHPRLSPAELAHIQSDKEDNGEPDKTPWFRLLTYRQVLVICVARFLTDPVWWFLLYWLPKFLESNHDISLLEVGPPLIVIYLMADLGSLGGGWLSSFLIKKGMSLDYARKLTLLLCALGVVPIIFAANTESLWLSVALISLATASHCGWMANVYTLVSDIFPKKTVGSIVGLSTLSAVLGSVVVASAVGYILEFTGSYYSIFFTAGFMYLLAWLIIHLGIREIRPLNSKASGQQERKTKPVL